MRRVRLLVPAALATLALGAVATASASAEGGDGPPALLVLAGKISELTAEAESGEKETQELSTAKGKAITSTAAKCKVREFTYSPIELEKDANLAKAECDFTGAEQGKTSCRSENSKGEKDPAGTILVLLKPRLGSEISGGMLVPLVFFHFLGILGESELTLVCGIVKDRVKGLLQCLLLPGLRELKASEPFELLCKGKEGKQETGECVEPKEECEDIKNEPLEATLGSGFEPAAERWHAIHKFSVDVLIDD